MFRIIADNANNPLSADEGAFITHFFNGWADFHMKNQ